MDYPELQEFRVKRVHPENTDIMDLKELWETLVSARVVQRDFQEIEVLLSSHSTNEFLNYDLHCVYIYASRQKFEKSAGNRLKYIFI